MQEKLALNNNRTKLKTASSDRWDFIWASHKTEDRHWDYLSEVVFQVLKREFGSFVGKNIIEAGSGTGRISLRLAGLGAKVTLLDYSKEALNNARKIFKNQNLSAEFIQADIFNMKPGSKTYDLVWNAGVMEHYPYNKQKEFLKKLLKICDDRGKVIVMNPFRRSFVYNVGKKLLTKLNRWPFGKEFAINTIADINYEVFSNKTIKEYSIGFIVSLVDSYKFLPQAFIHHFRLNKLSNIFAQMGSKLFNLDKFLSKIFGGYLIVTVIKK